MSADHVSATLFARLQLANKSRPTPQTQFHGRMRSLSATAGDITVKIGKHKPCRCFCFSPIRTNICGKRQIAPPSLIVYGRSPRYHRVRRQARFPYVPVVVTSRIITKKTGKEKRELQSMTAKTTQQKNSPHTATMSIVRPHKPREALPKSPQSATVIDDSAKQKKITVKKRVSRETSAKST